MSQPTNSDIMQAITALGDHVAKLGDHVSNLSERVDRNFAEVRAEQQRQAEAIAEVKGELRGLSARQSVSSGIERGGVPEKPMSTALHESDSLKKLHNK